MDQSQSRAPLQDITVLDLTRVLAGPFCTQVLAWLGARVIKVEPPQGDDARRFGPFVDGCSAYFASLNRGKLSIALDLKHPGDRATFTRLLDKADVLVENFRPGVMERLGWGWSRLRQSHPRLIYAAISGFGQHGPYAQRPAYDLVIQAMGGIMSLTGPEGGPPTRVGTSIGDITAGLYAAIGILAALHQRRHTGRGTLVDISMLDCQVAILENAIARFAAEGLAPTPLGCRHPSITPFDLFSCQDGAIVIAAGNDRLFAKLCQTLNRPELARDPRFQDNPSRTQHHAELKRELESTLRRHTVQWCLERLTRAGIPCGPLNDVAALHHDPQVQSRNMLVDVPLGEQSLRLAGDPLKMGGHTDSPSRRPAPELDADRQAILAWLEE